MCAREHGDLSERTQFFLAAFAEHIQPARHLRDFFGDEYSLGQFGRAFDEPHGRARSQHGRKGAFARVVRDHVHGAGEHFWRGAVVFFEPNDLRIGVITQETRKTV